MDVDGASLDIGEGHMLIERNRWQIAVITLTFLLFVLSMRWGYLDQSPPRWDESHYLAQATVLHQTMSDKGLWAFLQQVFKYDRGRVMLIPIIAQPFFSVLGISLDSAMITINLFWFLLAWAIYGISRSIAGPRLGQKAGFFALALFSVYPLTTILSNYYLVEFPLVSFVCATNYSFLKFYHTGKKKWLWWAGVFVALGMLTKVIFPCFILSGIILFLLEVRKSRRVLLTLRLFAPVLIVPLLIAGPYYVYNFRWIVETTLSLSSIKLAKMYGFGPVFDWRTVLAYWERLLLNPTMLATLLCSMSVIAWLILKKKRIQNDATGPFPLGLLFIWFLLPFLLASFGTIKDPRYAYPCLVPLFVVAGIGISWLITFPVGIAVIILLFILPFTQYLVANNLVPQSVVVRLGSWGTDSAPSPNPSDWKIDDVVRSVWESLEKRGMKKEVMFLGGNWYFNINLLQFYGLRDHREIQYVPLPYYSYPDMTLSYALDFIASSPHCGVLYKTGPQFPEFASRLDKGILAALEQNTDYEPHDLQIIEPDGSRFYLLINRACSQEPLKDADVSALLSLSEPLVKTVAFGDQFMLLGALKRPGLEGFFVDFYWKSLRTQPKAYVVFTHLLDASGKIIGVLDHPQDENKAVVQEGMIWRDSVYVPASRLAGVKSIGLGLYIPPAVPSALPIRNGITDWDGRRLLIPLPS